MHVQNYIITTSDLGNLYNSIRQQILYKLNGQSWSSVKNWILACFYSIVTFMLNCCTVLIPKYAYLLYINKEFWNDKFLSYVLWKTNLQWQYESIIHRFIWWWCQQGSMTDSSSFLSLKHQHTGSEAGLIQLSLWTVICPKPLLFSICLKYYLEKRTTARVAIHNQHRKIKLQIERRLMNEPQNATTTTL